MMKRLSETGRALILPADISIPEAYILGYKEASEEFLEDLDWIDTPKRKQHIIEKWKKRVE